MRKSVHTIMRIVKILLCCGLAGTVAGCGTHSAAAGSAHSPTAQHTSTPSRSTTSFFPNPNSLQSLSGLTNYAATYSGMTFRFASLSNYTQTLNGLTQVNVNGRIYTNLGSLGWASVVQNNPINPLAQVSQQLLGLLHVTGEKVHQAGGCVVAHQAGTLYRIGFSGAGLQQNWQACIDTQHGWLLSLGQHTTDGTTQLSSEFEITQVGGIAPFPVPKNTPAS